MPAIHVRLVTVALIGAALAVSGAARPAEAGRTRTLPGPVAAEVVDVVDGDTLVVRARIWIGQQIETHVRLEGIDTPELRGRCAREREMAEQARRFLAKRVRGGAVRLLDIRADKYGNRIRARVENGDGADLGRALVEAGLARPYGGGTRQPWCAVAEAR